jgi:TPR repeat protein
MTAARVRIGIALAMLGSKTMRLVLLLCCLCSCVGPTRMLAGDSDLAKKLKHDCARDSKACVDLGLAYYSGVEVRQNLAWARELFDEACTFGVPSGCNDLGNMYLEGKGVERDLERARTLIESACIAKDEIACATLARIPAPRE